MSGERAPTCGACGIAHFRGVRNVALLVAGQLYWQARLCPGCEDDAKTRLRELLEGDRLLKVTRL